MMEREHDNDDGEILDEPKRVFRDGIEDRFMLALALRGLRLD
jgi:hypothetical protein